VRLVSINAWGGAMYGQFAAWLPQINPDVLCVQEVTHTHGHTGWTSFDDGDHALPQRADLLTDVRQAGDLAVLCGDLNLLPHSETFDVLREAGLVDLVGTADTRGSRYVKPVRHASYLLVSDPAAVRRFEVLTRPEVSDHRALLLEL